VENDLWNFCRKALEKERIGSLALWLGKFHAKEMDEARVPDITIQWMNEKMGYGVITHKFIRKWDFVGEYTGLVRRRRLIFPNLNDYCFMYPREWVSYKLYAIDSADQGNFTRFINHSDFPNLESVAVFKEGLFHIIFRAVQDILPGTELSYDYGDVYWNTRQKVHEKKPAQILT
jgi:SET domain-containing protein